MRDLDDAVLFVVGGGAAHVLDEAGPDSRFPLPTYRVNPRQAEITDDPEEMTPLARGDPEEIRSRLEGVRVVMVFAMLGGESGTRYMPEIISMARDAGCRVVSIASIPWELEQERRARAMEALPLVVGSSDRTLLMDVQTLVDIRAGKPEQKVHSFFRVTARALRFAIGSLASMLEGPFFSIFSQRAYTFAYANEMSPARAVEVAMESTVFETDPAMGKAVVAVSAGFGTAQKESIFETVVGRTGIIPEIVQREDMEDTKVLVYLPVDLSPRASRT